MNKFFNYWVILTMVIISCNSTKQNINEFDKLLCKKWELVAYEEGGKKYNTPEKFQTTRMNFYLDKRIESSGKEKPSIGDWSYDDKNKTITIIDKMTKEIVKVEVIKLSEKELVIQIGSPEARMLTLYMKPDIEP